MPDVPHSRLLLDGAHCERLPGDGWDDYVRPFRLLEDVHVLAALVGWLYGVGHECGWPSPLLLRLAGILGGCAEVARHPVACVGTQAVLAGLFEQFSALEGNWMPPSPPTPRPGRHCGNAIAACWRLPTGPAKFAWRRP